MNNDILDLPPSCVLIVNKKMQSIMLNKISLHFLLKMVLSKIRH